MSENKRMKYLFTRKVKNYNSYRRWDSIVVMLSRIKSFKDFKCFMHLSCASEKENVSDSRKYSTCHLKLHNQSGHFNEIPLRCQFLMLNPNNDVLKKSEVLNHAFKEDDYLLEVKMMESDELVREISYWSEDTLTIQCLMECDDDKIASFLNDNLVNDYETEIELYNDSVRNWSFKVSNFKDWSAIREMYIVDMSFKVNFRYVNDEVKVKLIPNFEDKILYASFKITLMDETDEEIIKKETNMQVICGSTYELPCSFHNQDLQKAKCFLSNRIRFKFAVQNIYSESCVLRNNSKKSKSKNSKLENRKSTDCYSCSRQNESTRHLQEAECLSYLQHDLRNLLKDNKFADVILQVDNEVFFAHKSLLAVRSPVFSTMFDQDIVESQFGTVDVNNVDSKTFKLFFEYIYTSSLEEMNEEIALNLLVLADKYQVIPLVNKCSRFLKSVLSHTNACSILLAADMVNNEDLKSASIEYMVENSTKILSSSEWLLLVKTNINLGTDVLVKVSKKIEDKSRM